MRLNKILYFFIFLFLFGKLSFAQLGKQFTRNIVYSGDLYVGAQQLIGLKNFIDTARISIVANQTSVLGNTHLVDTLLKSGIRIQSVMTPEHGFRGNNGAGELVDDTIDEATGLKLISLYGNHRKPKAEDLENVDIVVFDLQDVGTRFYTYISTLQYVMEACAENNKTLVILDRPNPNGFYIDGPVLKKEFSSFVGMQSIPVVHGLTIAEYALMLNGECWLKDSMQCRLKIFKVNGYNHKMMYQLPVKPSPNLPSMAAIYLYPSLCFFEGTPMSIGRGTNKPFQLLGHPEMKTWDTVFLPKSMLESAPNPPLKDTECKGFDLTDFGLYVIPGTREIALFWISEAYFELGGKDSFFLPFFDKLAGSDQLKKQIIEGKSDVEIRQSWQLDIQTYKQTRKKYLLYPDFE